MEFVEHGYYGTIPYDPNWSQVHDSDVFVLGPGDSHEFPISGGENHVRTQEAENSQDQGNAGSSVRFHRA